MAGPRLSNAERSRRYRANFEAKHGVSFNEASSLAKAQGLKAGARAKAIAAVTSTPGGAALLNYGGSDRRRREAQRIAEKAADLRVRQLSALRDVSFGRYGPADLADAEQDYGLPSGSLRGTFTADQRADGYDGPMVMRIASTEGIVYAVVADRAERGVVAAHWHSITSAEHGDPGPLADFAGVVIGGYTLETDLDRLRALSAVGSLRGGPYPELRAAA